MMETPEADIATPPIRAIRVLAQSESGASVKELATGIIEIAFENERLCLSSARYWDFMQLMSTAARAFVVSKGMSK
ncbi:MAG: hypothetical protein AB7N65_28020 [Vicinamibacterales bacterium]